MLRKRHTESLLPSDVELEASIEDDASSYGSVDSSCSADCRSGEGGGNDLNAKISTQYRGRALGNVVALLAFVTLSASQISYLDNSSSTNKTRALQSANSTSPYPAMKLIANPAQLYCNDEIRSSDGIACAAEKMNIKLGEKALFPLTEDSTLVALTTEVGRVSNGKIQQLQNPSCKKLDPQPKRVKKNSCALCKKISARYDMSGFLYFTRVAFEGATTEYAPRRKSYLFHPVDVRTFFYDLFGIRPPPVHPDESYVNRISMKKSKEGNNDADGKRLRIDDAEGLLLHAKDAFSNKEYTNALALSSTARSLLHAATPEELYMKKGGMLYDAILDYNKYLKAHIDEDLKDRAKTDEDKIYIHKLSSCPKHMDTSYKKEVTEGLEPIYYDSRNFDFHELDVLIGMAPYRVLPTFPSVRERTYNRNILLDVGSNRFLGSPKAMIDMYAPFMNFDEIHMFESDSAGMIIPEYYEEHYSIHCHQMNVTVGTRDEKDIVTWLENNVEEDDFVVLKFDADHGAKQAAYTMEWGFLSDLIHSEGFSLVDEYYTDLNFYNPGVKRFQKHHSIRQSYDVLRQLRECGVAIHAWP